jgi:arsenical pump membrane protein
LIAFDPEKSAATGKAGAVRRPGRRNRWGRWLLAVAAGAFGIGALASPAAARASANQTWPPFVLVAGLLMIGVVAYRDGVFGFIATLTLRIRAHPSVLLLALLGVVAGVTVVLNLDTSVAFLTPVLVLAARGRGLDEDPFLYGTLLMSNGASLLLPGSNLTNLLVLAQDHVPGAVFAARMLPAEIAAVTVIAGAMVVVQHRRLRRAPPIPGGSDHRPEQLKSEVPVRIRSPWSGVAIAASVALLLGLRSPALPVLAVGVLLAALAIRRRTISLVEVFDAIDPLTLLGVAFLAGSLGILARTWDGPAQLVATAGGAQTAAMGALASVAINNLPAAVLLSSHPPLHPRALLLGLNLGPNLAVTGSLSALIWYRSATAVGAKPSALRVSRLGAVVAPLSLAAAGLALRLFSAGRL